MNLVNFKNINYLISLLVFTLMARSVGHYYVDVPVWDQWQFVSTLDDFYKNGFVFSDLIALHHEHRIFFPRIIMLALANFSSWNIFYEHVAVVVLCAGVYLTFMLIIKGCIGQDVHFIAPAIAVLVFSHCQVENLLWGWQISIFMSVLFLLITVYLLNFKADKFLGVFLAALTSVVSTLSFANGLLCLPIGFLLLIQHKTISKFYVPLWALFSGVLITLYLWNFKRDPADPPTANIIGMPLQYLNYVLAYLGSPLQKGSLIFSTISGLLGVTIFFILTAFLYRKGTPINKLAPLVAITLFSVASALMSGVGRLGMGVDQSLASRYTTISIPFWVSLIAVIYFCISIYASRQKKIAMIGGISVVFVLSIKASVQHLPSFKAHHDYVLAGREALLLLPVEDPKRLGNICWDSDYVAQQSKFLMENKLSVFR